MHICLYAYATHLKANCCVRYRSATVRVTSFPMVIYVGSYLFVYTYDCVYTYIYLHVHVVLSRQTAARQVSFEIHTCCAFMQLQFYVYVWERV